MLQNLTVRAKLAIAFSTLSLLVLLVAALSLRALSDANDRFTQYLQGVNARANTADELHAAVDRRAVAARNLVLVTSPADVEAEKRAVLKAHEDVGNRLAELNKMAAAADDLSPEGLTLISDIAQVEKAYGPVALHIVELALAGQRDEAIAKMTAECRPLLASLIKASEAYAAHTNHHAEQIAQAAVGRYAVQRGWLIAACTLAFLGAAVAGVLITRGLMKSLGAEPAALGLAAERIASGDLGHIEGAESAPAASVLASLGAMQGALASIVSQVRGTSDSIATGSAEIASGNADLSQRTEEQATALQQTSATMTQLGGTVRTNAENAQQANQLALSASAVATRGGQIVGEVVDTMRGIETSSRRIADIISVIDGIAFQTNILALNAAVEAARAGEQGRGFAVVASEVRSLAQRSAAAAKEINGLITASVERVAVGTAQVDRAGATMQEIVTSIARVTDIVGEISQASAEQSAGLSQVGLSVGQLDAVTQQNAALVEESAAAAESLKVQAAHLVEAVAVFRLSGGAPTASAGTLHRVARPVVATRAPRTSPVARTAPASFTPAAATATAEGWGRVLSGTPSHGGRAGRWSRPAATTTQRRRSHGGSSFNRAWHLPPAPGLRAALAWPLRRPGCRAQGQRGGASPPGRPGRTTREG